MNRTQGHLFFGVFTLAIASCATTSPPSTASPSFAKEKLSTNDDPHLPPGYRGSTCGDSVSGAYRLCLSPQGTIRSVEAVQSIPDADPVIMDTLKRWRYKPPIIPFCFVQNLQFQIECRKQPSQQSAAGAAPSAAEDPLANPQRGAARPALQSAPAAAEIPWPDHEGAAGGGQPPLRVGLDKDDSLSFEQAADERSARVQRVRSPHQVLWSFTLPAEPLPAAALLIDKDCLFIAHYSVIASGVTIHALDLNSGRERWQTRAQGLGPIAHSKYANHVALAMVRGYLTVFGRESAGRYIELLEPKSGQVLSTRTLPAVSLLLDEAVPVKLARKLIKEGGWRQSSRDGSWPTPSCGW